MFRPKNAAQRGHILAHRPGLVNCYEFFDRYPVRYSAHRFALCSVLIHELHNIALWMRMARTQPERFQAAMLAAL